MQFDHEIDAFIKEFVTDLQSKSAAVFAGAGMSKASGYVDWPELLRDIATELGLTVDKENDLISLAQYHVNHRVERLQQLGFSGCGAYLELENGYFYPQSPILHPQEVLALASGDLTWQFGAPGLLVSESGTDIHHFLDVGVFVGRIPKIVESVEIQ